MKTHHRLLVSATTLLLALAASALASAKAPSHSEVDMRALREAARPFVLADGDSIRFTAPAVAGFKVLNVRIYSPGGEKIIEKASPDGRVEIDLLSLEDGDYQFESVAVIEKASWREDESSTVTARNFGSFVVLQGRIVLPIDQQAIRVLGDANGPGAWIRLAAWVLDALVSDAAAANVDVSSSFPQISFEDSDFNVNTKDWYITANMNTDVTGSFSIINNTMGDLTDVIEISSASGPDRIEILSNRIDFMFNRFAMTDASRLGIGTVTPDYTLHISESNPRIYLFDESTSSNMNFEYAAGSLIIEGDSFQDIVRLYKDAPADSFRIFNNGKSSFGGNVGIGTTDPLAPLQINNVSPAIRMDDTSAGAGLVDFRLDTNRLIFEGNSQQDLASFDTRAPNAAFWLDQSGNVGMGTVSNGPSLQIFRANGTAQIHVVESSAPAPRTLFRLSNAGNTKFEIDETSSGNTWAFTNSGSDFRISLQDSGVVEFRVDNNGDAFLAGALTQNSDRDAKQDIVPVDAQDILQRVIELPISRWQYRDAPGVAHLGPMAQDFHAAFGLGATEKGISSIDTGGVALAAIQAMNAQLADLRERNQQLEQTVAGLLRDQQQLIETVSDLLENRQGAVLTAAVSEGL